MHNYRLPNDKPITVIVIIHKVPIVMNKKDQRDLKIMFQL